MPDICCTFSRMKYAFLFLLKLLKYFKMTQDQLNEKITTLENTVASEAQQYQQVINEKNSTIDQQAIRIAELETQVANGANIPDEIGTRLDNLNTSTQAIVP